MRWIEVRDEHGRIIRLRERDVMLYVTSSKHETIDLYLYGLSCPCTIPLVAWEARIVTVDDLRA